MSAKPKRESLPTDIHQWNWWFNALMPDGTKCKFKGTIEAPNDHMGSTASDKVNTMMRSKHPTARWWRGNAKGYNIDSTTCKIGPTVQRGKFLRPGEVA